MYSRGDSSLGSSTRMPYRSETLSCRLLASDLAERCPEGAIEGSALVGFFFFSGRDLFE